jgi:chemotaxis methyl-accepting protein methylase
MISRVTRGHRSSVIDRIYQLDGFGSFQEFLSRIRSDVGYFDRLVEEITVNVTEMFRDPSFYKVLREEILPALRSKPFIRIWHAGCSTGQEVYSMAILLEKRDCCQIVAVCHRHQSKCARDCKTRGFPAVADERICRELPRFGW